MKKVFIIFILIVIIISLYSQENTNDNNFSLNRILSKYLFVEKNSTIIDSLKNLAKKHKYIDNQLYLQGNIISGYNIEYSILIFENEIVEEIQLFCNLNSNPEQNFDFYKSKFQKEFKNSKEYLNLAVYSDFYILCELSKINILDKNFIRIRYKRINRSDINNNVVIENLKNFILLNNNKINYNISFGGIFKWSPLNLIMYNMYYPAMVPYMILDIQAGFPFSFSIYPFLNFSFGISVSSTFEYFTTIIMAPVSVACIANDLKFLLKFGDIRKSKLLFESGLLIKGMFDLNYKKLSFYYDPCIALGPAFFIGAENINKNFSFIIGLFVEGTIFSTKYYYKSSIYDETYRYMEEKTNITTFSLAYISLGLDMRFNYYYTTFK